MTIIEVMVVIGIVAMLMAIALPALRSVRTTGRITVEQNAARQLMAAYIAYANVNQDRLLTGVAPTNFKAFDAKGHPITLAPARQRYMWRIAPYLDHRIDALFLHEHRELIDEAKYREQHDMYVYHASLVPSFGINARWIGGDFSKSANPPACLEQDMFEQPCATYNALFGRFWLTRISEPRTPERLIVFASARGPAPLEAWGTDTVEGYYHVQSPHFTKAQSNWSDTFSRHGDPAKFGFVSPRHNGHAVIGFMDGRAGLLTAGELSDMRHWADQADSPEWFMKAKAP